MHALTVIRTYLRLGILNVVQYRGDFFLQIVSIAISLTAALLGLGVIFSQTGTLGGWTQNDLIALLGIQMLVRSLLNLVVRPSMQQMMEGIREGTFDFTLTKPADAQLLASVARVNVAAIADVVSGLIVLGIAIARLGSRLDALDVLLFAVMLLAGVVMVYSFLIMLSSTAFWFVRVDNILVIFNTMFENAGKWPITIFPGWLKTGLTFVIPVAFAVTVPAQAVTGRLTWGFALGAIGLAVLFVVASRLFWRLALTRYTGASA